MCRSGVEWSAQRGDVVTAATPKGTGTTSVPVLRHSCIATTSSSCYRSAYNRSWRMHMGYLAITCAF
jgi:hypothetical protein